VDEAVRQGLVDGSRLGIGGWSYGGYLTNRIVTRTDRFEAAVSGAGLANILADYGVSDTPGWLERELGLPWTTTGKYIAASPLFQVDRVRTPTLVLCGQDDMRTPLDQSEQWYQALKRVGVEAQLVVYPGEGHSPSAGAWDDVVERTVGWYTRWLRPGGRTGKGAALARNDVAHAAAGVGDVSPVPRDEVDVEVEDGLASGLADVDADVEAVGVVATRQEIPGTVDGCGDRCLLVLARVEPGRDVPSGDDEEMAFADREGVPEGPRQAVFEGDPVAGGGAERAIGGCRHRGRVGCFVLRVISSRPSRPAATHTAQRQLCTGRRPSRLDWQTGHQCS
jgi:hypothetical protein